MNTFPAATARYESPGSSVRKVVELVDGCKGLSGASRVFIKPNIVFWSRTVPFPKWGVITTSRVVEDVVSLLAEHGVTDITIGEGTVVFDPKDMETARHAHETLGYGVLGQRYGVKSVNVFERPFVPVDLGDGTVLNFNRDALESDFVVSIPVLKTHAQTVVSLGIKNIKGLIDIPSRKKCHSADPVKDLNFMVARLADKLPPSLTVLDGIYTTERGPAYDGTVRRSNLLVASRDMLSADKVGARLLGYEPGDIPHLAHAARNRNRPVDLSDVEALGERVEELAQPHAYAFEYTEDGSLPLLLAQMGIKGVSFPKYDLSLCTYCSSLTGVTLASIARAWRGQPWDNVEILTGKIKTPTPGKKTVLIGKCLYEAHKNHPDIERMITVKTCPPMPKLIVKALHEAGIEIDPTALLNLDKAPGHAMGKYKNRPEFDEAFFRVS
ncbi:MAG: DUF362 domain-containing protein [Thermodesulfobacteriota bacterium]